MIAFVIGPSCAGKSTFIKENFPEFKKIDLYDFQTDNMSVEEVWQSYLECRDALKEAVSDNENVVLEHTLLKRHRRDMYIEAVKEVGDFPIDIYVILPDVNTLLERRRARGIKLNSSRFLQEEIDMCDIPIKEDGFNKIVIINN